MITDVRSKRGGSPAGCGAAVSRYNFRIKNNLDEPISYRFDFYINRGLLEIDGIRSDHTAHARVEAMIDYVLLSPAGPFGGHYEETTGQLFNYFADIFFDNRRAMLGDPTDLVGGPGIRLVQEASQVPEPATMLLLGAGLVVMGALRRRCK